MEEVESSLEGKAVAEHPQCSSSSSPAPGLGLVPSPLLGTGCDLRARWWGLRPANPGTWGGNATSPGLPAAICGPSWLCGPDGLPLQPQASCGGLARGGVASGGQPVCVWGLGPGPGLSAPTPHLLSLWLPSPWSFSKYYSYGISVQPLAARRHCIPEDLAFPRGVRSLTPGPGDTSLPDS